MKTIGIKLADGSFYPVLQEGHPEQKKLELITAHNNQTRVMVDLYRSETASMDDAEYVDTLQIENIKQHPRGEAGFAFNVAIDENNELSANIVDEETGAESKTTIELVNRTLEERMADESDAGYDIAESSVSEEEVMAEPFEEPAEEVPVEEPVVEEEPAKGKAPVAAAVAGGGLLAAAMLVNQRDEEKPEAEEAVVEETIVEEVEEEPVAEPVEESVIEETLVDIPDFEDNTPADEPVAEEDSFDAFAEETISDDDPLGFDLPDFDDELPQETVMTSADEALMDNTETESLFDLPDFEETPVEETKADPMDWDFEEELTRAENSESTDNNSALSFTGLYDKETEFGDSYEDEEDDVQKKTRTPVIICVICAIICIIAVLLILFVIPSKLNVLKKGHKNEVKIEVVEAEPAPAPVVKEPEPAPVVPSAKEDEIVIIEEAEEVIPEPPAPPKEEPKPDIIYKIKWGDTLWDIADTYYKNPWRYKKIARYNGIKDPDYIISGTRIRIPQE
ncbi:MAG: LysM peptidoglycan-binding domain-containing protein [Treponema sp.]|nr:LysM peptidoglycan-binding domain-containing protein [Treponema sp.]